MAVTVAVAVACGCDNGRGLRLCFAGARPDWRTVMQAEEAAEQMKADAAAARPLHPNAPIFLYATVLRQSHRGFATSFAVLFIPGF